jgi:perosamine synthetase
MTNLQAAIGLAQVEQLDGLVAQRRRNAALYNELLMEVPGIVLPPEASNVESVFWMYSILLGDEFGMTRDQLRWFLADKGIETRTFFIPIHFQPIYYATYKGQRYPVAEDLCRRGLYLPSSPSLSKEEIRYVTEAVKKAQQACIPS